MCAPLDLSAGPGKSNNTLAGPENRRSNRPLIPWSSIFGLATRIRISIGLKKSRLSKQPLHCTAYLNSESSNPVELLRWRLYHWTLSSWRHTTQPHEHRYVDQLLGLVLLQGSHWTVILPWGMHCAKRKSSKMGYGLPLN